MDPARSLSVPFGAGGLGLWGLEWGGFQGLRVEGLI